MLKFKGEIGQNYLFKPNRPLCVCKIDWEKSKTLISKTIKAHEKTSYAPSISKTLICEAHGMASYAP